tara:strand:+ start:156 stop:602 length:447 start_codon:yes stop_codon:yes gene_type:complete
VINKTKKFNKKLWIENDKRGKEFAISLLKNIYNNNIKIIEGEKYGVDLKIFNKNNVLIKTAEVEVRHNWNTDSKFPFNTLNIPYRKKKFFITNNCEYISINNLFTRCLLIKEKDILESPIEENKNKYIKTGEKFYKVDITKCKEYMGK